MRNYLYCWNQPAERRFIASGLEFKDLLPVLASSGGLYLLRHQWDEDNHQGFDFVSVTDLSRLASEDLDSWGDFAWVDYPQSPRRIEPPDLPPESIAELLYFGHALEPLRDIAISGLGNRFLGSGHDDGWRLILRYTQWRHIEELLSAVLPPAVLDEIMPELRDGTRGFWLEHGRIENEEMTLDIDAVMNRRLAILAPDHEA